MQISFRFFVIVCFFHLLLSCGGSGGGSGGDGGSTPSESPPNDEEWTPPTDEESLTIAAETPDQDPFLGDEVQISNSQWTIQTDEGEFTLTPSSNENNLYFFDALNANSGVLNIVGASNADVTLYGGQFNQANSEPEVLFGINQLPNTQTPVDVSYYTGYYTAIDENGNTIGTWKMEIRFDGNVLRNSYAVSLDSQTEIRIYFNALNEGTIIGTISDPNHDYNSAIFGFYGPENRTLAGGYGSEIGSGVLLAEH